VQLYVSGSADLDHEQRPPPISVLRAPDRQPCWRLALSNMAGPAAKRQPGFVGSERNARVPRGSAGGSPSHELALEDVLADGSPLLFEERALVGLEAQTQLHGRADHAPAADEDRHPQEDGSG
jgi:hypothetical protein